MSDLDKAPAVFKLASDLGLTASKAPSEGIRSYARRRIRKILKEAGHGRTPAEDLEIARAALGTTFVVIQSDEDLAMLQKRYVTRREFGFAMLADEFDGDVLAVTIQLTSPKQDEPLFVSVIDARGDRSYRIFFSKWHELAHLVTMTDQSRIRFHRTHADAGLDDPEERLMDKIAGDCAFLPERILPHLPRDFDLNALVGLKKELCPECSEQAFLIGVMNAMPTGAILIRAQFDMKVGQKKQLAQSSFDFRGPPALALRAVETNSNDVEPGFMIPRNMRVPANSVIARVMETGDAGNAREDLSWWSTQGRSLRERAVDVSARKTAAGVQALLVPRKSSNDD